MPNKNNRDYKKEYSDFHGTAKQKKLRALRNNARRNSSCVKGDGKEVDHIKPLSNGGTNDASNQQILTRHQNRKKGVSESWPISFRDWMDRGE